MTRGQQHDLSAAHGVPPEPFAWMSTKNPTGPYRFRLATPTSEAVFGIFLVVAGVLLVVSLWSDSSAPAIALAVLVFLIFVGFGVLLLIMAVYRHRWAKAYTEVHGHPPY